MSLLVEASRVKISRAAGFRTSRARARYSFCFCSARGGDPVDLPERRAVALERQEPRRDEEIDPTLQETLHPVVVVLQKERRQEQEFHLLARRILQLVDPEKRVIAMGAPGLPVRRCEAEDLVSRRGAVTGRGLVAFALHVEDHGRALPGEQVRNDEAGGFSAPGRRHDQRVGEGLRAEEWRPRRGASRACRSRSPCRVSRRTRSVSSPAGSANGCSRSG